MTIFVGQNKATITFNDYRIPSYIAHVTRCNLDCAYCHNKHNLLLIKPTSFSDYIDIITEHRKKTKSDINVLVLSGGEPLFHDINILKLNFDKLINEGFSIKLDTNGMYPDKLKILLNRELISAVALDIKTDIRSSITSDNLFKTGYAKNLNKTIKILDDLCCDVQFRTTLCDPYFNSWSHFLEVVDYVDNILMYKTEWIVRNANLDSKVYKPGICNEIKIGNIPTFNKIDLKKESDLY